MDFRGKIPDSLGCDLHARAMFNMYREVTGASLRNSKQSKLDITTYMSEAMLSLLSVNGLHTVYDEDIFPQIAGFCSQICILNLRPAA
jgi:hypothetical protein